MKDIIKEIGDLDQKIKSDIKIAAGTGYLGFHQASKKFAEKLIQEIHNKLLERSLKQTSYESIKGSWWEGLRIYFEGWPEFKEFSSYIDWEHGSFERYKPILDAIRLALDRNGFSQYEKNYRVSMDNNNLYLIWELADFDINIGPGTLEFFKDPENIEKCMK
jgi:hypothetical protein